MTIEQQVKEYEARGFTLQREQSFLNGNCGWLWLEKYNLYKLFQVNKSEYDQIMATR